MSAPARSRRPLAPCQDPANGSMTQIERGNGPEALAEYCHAHGGVGHGRHGVANG